MSENRVVLRNHRLSHLPEIIADEIIFEKCFNRECSLANCNAHCCRDGVPVDIEERENILTHAKMIQRFMDPHQEKNPAKWFEKGEEEDSDFPSGQCGYTAAREAGCAFLDSKGLCVLQRAAVAQGMHKYALKPFYCVAYPLAIDEMALTTVYSDFANREVCCSTVPKGELTVFDVCREELEFVLGKEGLKELESLRKHR